jgi:two-component system, chemotaxis family, response regulator Rcp1
MSDLISILLVEDNPGDIRLIQEVFKEYKIHNHLEIVRDGEEALDFLYKRGSYSNISLPDLILLDLNLPRKDGREVLADIKSNNQLKHIPVVVLTSSQSETDILKSYDLNANCYITKPVDLDKFIDIVKIIETFWLTIVKLPRRS